MTRTTRTRAPAAPGQPYLRRVYVVPERVPTWDRFPFHIPWVRALDLDLDQPVTFLVGENGSGKSTLLEAIAQLAGYHASGGGRNDVTDASRLQRDQDAPLASALRPVFRRRPRDGFFFRAETLVNFATLLEQRATDPGFGGDPYARYGGQNLHERSHGEAFLQLLEHRVEDGLFLLDEPEAALSPLRQLSLLHLMWPLVARGRTQFIIATHAPILLTFPDARIIDFDDPTLPTISLEQTRHYQITRGVLDAPDRYWKHLKDG